MAAHLSRELATQPCLVFQLATHAIPFLVIPFLMWPVSGHCFRNTPLVRAACRVPRARRRACGSRPPAGRRMNLPRTSEASWTSPSCRANEAGDIAAPTTCICFAHKVVAIASALSSCNCICTLMSATLHLRWRPAAVPAAAAAALAVAAIAAAAGAAAPAAAPLPPSLSASPCVTTTAACFIVAAFATAAAVGNGVVVSPPFALQLFHESEWKNHRYVTGAARPLWPVDDAASPR